MATYAQTKQKLLKQTFLGDLVGIPLEGRGRRKGWLPVRPCITTGKEQYTCEDLADVIVWVRSNVRAIPTGYTCGRSELLRYEVESDARILVETYLPMTLEQLRKTRNIAEKSNRRARIVFHSAGEKNAESSLGVLLTEAFQFGWQIGERLHDHTTITERICDWFAGKFRRRRDRNQPPRVTTSIVHVQSGTDA